MFCSNCGKTIRPEENECRHCGAFLGEDRFYGSTYTSSQVRVPVESLNQAPKDGMISYTRTNYMSPEFQPADDVYSNTTYRPLLTDEEDLDLQEAEEAARLAEEEAARQAEEEAVKQAEAEQPAEEVSGEETEPDPSAEAEFEEEIPAEDVADVPEEEPEEDYPTLTPEELDREFPLDPLKKAAISPRVLSYMEEIDRRQQRKTENAGGLRLPSFLKRKIAPVQEEAYEDELPEAEDVVAAEETEGFESSDEAEEYIDADEYAETEEYVGEEAYDDAAEYADEYAEAEYAEPDSDEMPAEEYDDYAESDADELAAEEYVADAEGDDFEHYEDADYIDDDETASTGFSFDFGALLESSKSLLQNRILQISAAAVLIVVVIAVGIVWLNFVTAKRAKIADVTYSAYSQGIELMNTRIGEEYRSTMEQVYLTNTGYANETFTQDMAALNALMPEEPLANDELFVTALTNIQDAIANAIKADANAVLNGADAEYAATSELTWQAISNAVSQLSEATNPSELSVIVVSLQDIVAPTATPTPPAAVEEEYVTLTNGMMDDTKVKMMQNRLINLGFLDAEYPDGDFGNGTEAAVKAFQRAIGMTADGIATPEMQKALFADDAPRTGSALLNATETPAPDADDAVPQNPVTE